MNFDTIISNPPYQKGITSEPVYHWFMDASYLTASKVLLITPARWLFNAGKTPREWNTHMLEDPHLKVLRYDSSSLKVFPDIDIGGGVAITYRDRGTDFGAIHEFFATPEQGSITDKVKASNFVSIQNIIYIHNKFNLEVLYREHPECRSVIRRNGRDNNLMTGILGRLPDIFHTEREPEDIKVHGILNGRRAVRYIDRRYILPSANLDKYKVLLPGVRGHRPFGWTLPAAIVTEPQCAYTQTFIGFGAFDTLDEALAMEKYLHTRLCRCMLYTLKSTQQNRTPTWANVPLQDFSKNSDIDWSSTVSEIDKQFYKKYNFSDHEVNFLETHAKEMPCALIQ